MNNASGQFKKVCFRIFPLWLSAIWIGIAWVNLSSVYTSAYGRSSDLWVGNVFILLGIAGTICALWEIELHIAPSYYWLLVPLLLFSILMPRPYTLGPLIIAFGLILFLISKNDPLFSRFTPGLLLSGLMISLNGLLVPFWYYLSCHERGLPFMAGFLSKIFNFLGTNATANGYTLLAQVNKDYRQVQVTVDALGLLPALFILIGIALCWSLCSGNKNNRSIWPKLLIVWGLYIVIRYLVLIWVFLAWPDRSNISLMWKPFSGFLSFLPLALILTLIHKRWSLTGCVSLSWTGWPRCMQRWLALVLCTTVAGIFGAALTDPGHLKKGIGRLLIDEGHSEWEDTTRPFDTTWYGRDSTYNYYCMGKFLENYYTVTINNDPIIPELIEHQDIVMLKCPTNAYTNEEVEALIRFVNNGGGLFLIGDHTDVFGFATIFNPLAKRFGLEFNKDCQYDIYGSFSRYKQPAILGHPVGKYTQEILFATGCTLCAPIWAEKPIIGYGMMTREANYGNKNFFPHPSHDEDREFGLFLQAAGVYKGKGRVLCFTDSTIWSNFSMFLEGKPELLLDCLAWLNRSNTTWALIKPYVIFLAFILLFILIITSPSTRTLQENHHWLLSLLLVVVIISCYSVDVIHRYNYRKPEALRAYPKVAFDLEHSDIFLANRAMFPSLDKRESSPSYEAFFVSVQRLGMVPQVSYSLPDSIQAHTSPIVIINPNKKFTEKQTDSFLKFIAQGGKALIIDSGDRYTTSYSWQLIEPLGLKILYYNTPARVLSQTKLRQAKLRQDQYQQEYLFSRSKDISESFVFQTQEPGEIEGGVSLLWYTSPESRKEQDREQDTELSEMQLQQSDKWKSCLSEISFGKGIVMVCTLSKAFSQRGLGYSGGIPNEEQEHIYKVVYQILNDLN